MIFSQAAANIVTLNVAHLLVTMFQHLVQTFTTLSQQVLVRVQDDEYGEGART